MNANQMSAVSLAFRKIRTRIKVAYLRSLLEEREYTLDYFQSIGDKNTLELRRKCIALRNEITKLEMTI